MTNLERAISRRGRLACRAAGDRRLVVTLRPTDTICIRAERCRHRYSVTFEDLYWFAVKSHVEFIRREKRSKRK